MARQRKLTGATLDEAKRRYKLWDANRPFKIAMDLGVDQWTLSKAIGAARRGRGRSAREF